MNRYIKTVDDLLSLGISKFEVINGAWIGEIQRNDDGDTLLIAKDFGGNIMNQVTLKDQENIDLDIVY